MGRFLTEVAGFANTPGLLGSVELVEGNRKAPSPSFMPLSRTRATDGP